MGRRQIDSESARSANTILLLIGFVSCGLVYTIITSFFDVDASSMNHFSSIAIRGDQTLEQGECCSGIEHLELWGTAVKWGSEFKFNSSEHCCRACKVMCNNATDGSRSCDSWVFCGDKRSCGSRFGECWLKKQGDGLAPERREVGPRVMWTSGLIFGNGEGVVGLETEHGTLAIKLLPHTAPRSVSYILELLALNHCAGCHFYRAEGRGNRWDSDGNHVDRGGFGPPYALIQGRLEAQGTGFNEIPPESESAVRRGSVAWVDSGPDFFISLADHHEWRNKHTVFGYVLPDYMDIAEKIARSPVKAEVWNHVSVSVLEQPISIRVGRIQHASAGISFSS